MSDSADIQQALRNIYGELGGINAKLAAGSKRHDEFSRGLVDLDGKLDDVIERVGKVESLTARIPVIEPAVWALEGKRLRRDGATEFVGKAFKVGHVVTGVVASVLTWIATHLAPWPWPR